MPTSAGGVSGSATSPRRLPGEPRAAAGRRAPAPLDRSPGPAQRLGDPLRLLEHVQNGLVARQPSPAAPSSPALADDDSRRRRCAGRIGTLPDGEASSSSWSNQQQPRSTTYCLRLGSGGSSAGSAPPVRPRHQFQWTHAVGRRGVLVGQCRRGLEANRSPAARSGSSRGDIASRLVAGSGERPRNTYTHLPCRQGPARRRIQLPVLTEADLVELRRPARQVPRAAHPVADRAIAQSGENAKGNSSAPPPQLMRRRTPQTPSPTASAPGPRRRRWRGSAPVGRKRPERLHRLAVGVEPLDLAA